MGVLKKISKYFLIFIGIVVLLIFGVVIAIQLPSVQNFVKDQLISYLEKKINTKVELERIKIGFPNTLLLENLYLQGQSVDTLLYARSLEVGLDMYQLVNSKADITSVSIQDLKANVVKDSVGVFNFQYIIDAFATDEKDVSESKPFIISLDKINLKDIAIIYKDEKTKNDLDFYFKLLDTRVSKFDLDSNSYGLKYVTLDGFKFFMNQDIVETISDEVVPVLDSVVTSKPLKLDLGTFTLTNFDIGYNDANSKTLLISDFKELIIDPGLLDLNSNRFEIESVSLSDANVLAELFLSSSASTSSSKEASSSSSLNVVVKDITFKNVNAHYKNTNGSSSFGNAINFDNIKLSNFSTKINDVVFNDLEILANIKSLSVEEQSGLKINSLKANVKYAEEETFVKDLYLETPNTLLRDEMILKYKSKSDLTDNLEKVDLLINLDRSTIGFEDILKIAPQLKSTVPFNHYPKAKLYANTTVRGNLKKLYIDELELRGIDKTSIKASGKINNVMNSDLLSFDLKVRELKSDASTLNKILPQGVIPNMISLPSTFSVAGTIKGSLQKLQANLGLISSYGNAKIKADFDQRVKNKEIYDIDASLQNFDIGKLIKNNQIGKITANVKVKGKSLDFTQADAVVSGTVYSAYFNKYTYKNVVLNGGIKSGNYNLNLVSTDENAQLNLTAKGNYNSDKLSVALKGRIDKVNLKELQFSESTMSFAGDIDGEFSNLDPDALNGQLFLENFAISDGNEIYPIQDLRLYALSNEENNTLQLNSQVLDIQLVGKYKLTQITSSLLQTINTYYQFTEPVDLDKMKVDPGQYFTLFGAIKDDDLIRKFVPDLSYFETINLVGNYNADERKIVLNGTVPLVEYGSNKVENVLINLENDTDALRLVTNVGGFSNTSFAFNEVNLGAQIANNTIEFDLSVLDDKKELQYYIAGLLDAQSPEKKLVLDNDGFKLNYENWKVADDNYLALAANGLYAHNILLENNESQIFIDSEEDNPESPLNISLKDFQIETITRIIQMDSLLASGVINGTAQIKDLQKQMSFNADMNVSDLKIYGSKLGKLTLQANNSNPERIQAIARLSEFNNDLVANGYYATKNGEFDFDIDVNSLQMESIQGFSMNQIKEAKGFISGNLKASGNVSAPKIIGKLSFNEVGMRITQLNSVFQNINDAIEFRSNGIYFNRFKINDSENNPLVIDGSILTDTYRDFRFGLNVSANDFKIVNSSEENSQLLYGVMAVDANLNIRGDLNLPKVDGRIEVTDQTDFTFILPQSSPALQDREGIIEFVDQDQTALLDTLNDEMELENTIEGLDVNVNISVVKEAKLSIVIDKTNGDFVKLQGEAELTGGIDPSGKMTLLGRYEVEEGAYEMSVNVLKRKFEIQEGSSITWTGEPMNADVDITAVYTTKAAPLDLVEQQLVGKSEAETNLFKQRIPFYANLIMKGELLKPIINFDIKIDKTNPSVDSQVTDMVDNKLKELQTSESELNKQVFALLLLNRFIGENPFQSSSGMSAEGMARQSVSKMLSQQLNNLASELVDGVDLNFDLESMEDFSTGNRANRTELNVDISKRLFDDRLKVSIGSNFGLEGQERQNENMTNIAGDINIEYKLSKDGRYLLKAYRKDEYQVALQGQIIETGVGFIITLEYDKFKELVRRRRSNKEFRREERVIRKIEEQQPIKKEDEE